MGSIHVFARKFTILNWIWNISSPETVDTVIKKEIWWNSISETENSSSKSLIGIDADIYKIQIFWKNHTVEWENGYSSLIFYAE
jgi:hypothetical protein